MPALHRPRETAQLVRDLLGDQPVTVADVLAVGISRGRLRAAVDAGHLVRVRHGVVAVALSRIPAAASGSQAYATACAEHLRLVAAAAARLGPDALISHESGALLLDHPLPRPGELPSAVRATAPGHGRKRAGIHLLDGLVDHADRTSVNGIGCTSVARTALDVACGRPLIEALVSLDAAAAVVGRRGLEEAFERLPPRRGAARLERWLSYADALAESPLESASRGLMIMNGLPLPQLQVWVSDHDGRRHRVDFLWPERRLIGEADGWGKYSGLEDLRAEKRREDALRDCGFTVVRWTSDELWRAPNLVVARWRRALDTRPPRRVASLAQ